MSMKNICKNNENEYITKARKYRNKELKGQKNKLPPISQTNFAKKNETYLYRKNKTLNLPKRKYMKKFFLVKRLNPRKQKEKVQDHDSEDKYFN